MGCFSEYRLNCAHGEVCGSIKEIKEVLNNAKLGIYDPFELVFICPEYINRNNLRKIEKGE